METNQATIRKSGLRTWFHDVTHCLNLTTLTLVRCGHAPFVKVGCTTALASTKLIQQLPRRATKVETCGPSGGIRDEVTVRHRRWLPISSLPGSDVNWSHIRPYWFPQRQTSRWVVEKVLVNWPFGVHFYSLQVQQLITVSFPPDTGWRYIGKNRQQPWQLCWT